MPVRKQKPAVRKKKPTVTKQKQKPGSVVVIDVEGYLGALLFLGFFGGGFGSAYGVFRGLWSKDQVVDPHWDPEVFRSPIFPHLIGAQSVVTYRQDLIDRFERPGILHEHGPGPRRQIPRFGMIEYPDYTTRILSAGDRERMFVVERDGGVNQLPDRGELVSFFREHCRPVDGARRSDGVMVDSRASKQQSMRDLFAEWIDSDARTGRAAKAAFGTARSALKRMGHGADKSDVKRVVKAFVESLNELALGIDSIRREQMTDVAVELAESAGVDGDQAFDWVEEFRDF